MVQPSRHNLGGIKTDSSAGEGRKTALQFQPLVLFPIRDDASSEVQSLSGSCEAQLVFNLYSIGPTVQEGGRFGCNVRITPTLFSPPASEDRAKVTLVQKSYSNTAMALHGPTAAPTG
jgi:hypothetical protein